MQLNEYVIPYLRDEKFSEGLYVKISGPEKRIDNRLDYIIGYAAGKKVIHVGCVDHIPLIEKKIKDNLWLHKRIDEVAQKQIGIDINREGIALVKEKFGYQNVYYEDIAGNEAPGSFIQKEKWDVMILGEILEHVDNPVHFLKQLKAKYAPFATEILVSVPNAFAWENFWLALRQKECINTDHRAWFSVYTLSKALTLAGFHNFFHHFVTFEPGDYKTSFFLRLMLKKYPALRSTIMTGARFNQA